MVGRSPQILIIPDREEQMNLHTQDLNQLAFTLSQIVQVIDFDGVDQTGDYQREALEQIDNFRGNDGNSVSLMKLLTSTRNAVANLTEDTPSFYVAARDIIRMATRPTGDGGSFWEKYSWTPMTTTLLMPEVLEAA